MRKRVLCFHKILTFPATVSMRIVRQNATLCEVEIGERLKSTFTCEKWNLTFHFSWKKKFEKSLKMFLTKRVRFDIIIKLSKSGRLWKLET